MIRTTLRRTWALITGHKPRLTVVRGDITTQPVNAVVNAAKSTLMGGGGVDGAIHRAGGPAILEACKELRDTLLPGGLPTGHAVATTAGDMDARWVIHTVGPVYSRDDDRTELLRACYRNSLREADRLGAQDVAFPLISSGVYGWPTTDAIRQAIIAIRSTRTAVRRVRLVLFDAETYWAAVTMARADR